MHASLLPHGFCDWHHNGASQKKNKNEVEKCFQLLIPFFQFADLFRIRFAERNSGKIKM